MRPKKDASAASKRQPFRSEPAEEEQLIAGRNPVLEALKSDQPLDTIYLSGTNGTLHQIAVLAKEKNILVKMVSDAALSKMTHQAVHQGVAASGACGQYVSVEAILQAAREKQEAPLLVICDEIQDPHNLGAIIRTAEAAGAHGIIIL